MESKVLQAIIQNRTAWEKVKELGVSESEFSTEASFILSKVDEFYDSDPNARSVDVELLCNAIKRSTSNDKRAERICTIVKSLPSEVSDLNIVKELVELKRDNVRLTIQGLLSGSPTSKQIPDLMAEYIRLGDGIWGGSESSSEEVITALPVGSLVQDHFQSDKLIQLWPKALNDLTDGGAKRGHHILVFAPTEMGKTLVVINMVAGFVRQGLRVLYIGNEDPAADIYMRYCTRITGLNKYEILKDTGAAQKLLDERNYGLLTLAPLAPGNFRQIKALVDKHTPDVVILDQLRNLDVQSDGRTQQLEKAATEARNLAKSRNVLVVSVTQAGDSASGKRVLSRGDVDSSNVGIPGQVDLMIGIGATTEEEMRNFRTFSFPKNKLSGKHDHFTLQIDPLLSKVND